MCSSLLAPLAYATQTPDAASAKITSLAATISMIFDLFFTARWCGVMIMMVVVLMMMRGRRKGGGGVGAKPRQHERRVLWCKGPVRP